MNHHPMKKPGLHCFIIFFFFFLASSSEAYDLLDPKGNVTIRWDIIKWGDDESVYDAKVLILNNQLFRHIEKPGWKLQWDWPGKEVIWHIQGAEATEQGDCHKIKGSELPHCCKKRPQIIDLLPGAPFNMRIANCCKGGELSSMNQDPSKYGAMFQMNVGNSVTMNTSTFMNNYTTAVNSFAPTNFGLGLAGYTCSQPLNVTPTRFPEDNGRRTTQAFFTWNVTCTYSQFQALPAPTCCVSLSAFYNDTITPCPKCSCACQGQPKSRCVKPDDAPLLRLPSEDQAVPPEVLCTKHMCPIRVHWHVKTSYTQYWRVKITINNFNYVHNYSQWTLVVRHPNLRSVEQVFSFIYKPLNLYSAVNDTGMFWGIQHYNDMLLQSGPSGNVQTELLLHKDDDFTFRDGWAFPRKISFNGQQCVMPQPDEFPRLPSDAPSKAISRHHPVPPLLIFLLILLTLLF